MSPTSAAQALAALKAAAASIPAARVPVSATVVAVESYSNGYTYAMTARLADGSQDVRVPLYGPQVKVGQGVRLTRAVGEMIDPAYEWAGREDPDTVFAEFEADPDVPEPAWGSPALTSTAMAPSPGGQMAVVTARIRETPEKYSPRMTEIRWQVAGEPTWHESLLPNVANEDAEHIFNIPASFPLGVTVNVQARTHTQGRAVSLYSQLRSIITAVNATVPTAPAGTITTVGRYNLAAVITFPNRSQPLIFDHWELSVADSATGLNANDPRAGSGAPPINAGPGPQYLYEVASERDIFVRAREVTTSGVAGPWWPSNSWDGPYSITATDVIVDTTPPPAPVVASATATPEFIQGVVSVTLTTTLDAYAKPSDFSHFLYRYDTPADLEQYEISPATTNRYLNARQGVTYQVSVQAWDVSGNASAFSANFPVTTPTIQQPPAPVAPVATAYPVRSIRITWPAQTETTTTGTIRQYNVYRSTDNVNFPYLRSVDAATALPTNTMQFIDADLNAATTYWYKVQSVNSGGIQSPLSAASNGVVPSLTTGADIAANAIAANHIQAGAIDVGKLAAGAVTAAKLAADIVLSTVIRATGIGAAIYGGNTRLASDGLRVNSDQGVRFIEGDIDTGAERAFLGPVSNFLGTNRNGVVLRYPPGQIFRDWGRLFVWTNDGSTNRWVEVSETDISFYVNGTRQWQIANGIMTNRVARVGQVTKLGGGLARSQVNLSGAAGVTTLTFGGSVAGIDADAIGVVMRISNTSGNEIWMSADPADREAGFYVPATATVGPGDIFFLGTPNGQLFAHALGNWSCIVMVTAQLI